MELYQPLIMDLRLFEHFKSVDDEKKKSLAEEISPLRLGLVILLIAQSELDIDYMSSSTISTCLEIAGVSLDPKSITKSFSRAGNKISRNTENDSRVYKIMTKGKQEVADFFLKKNLLKIFLVNNSKPYSTYLEIGDFLSNLVGDIRICDPYIGERTFAIISSIRKTNSIRFLTVNVNQNKNKVKSIHKDFLKEFPNFQLRVFPNASEIHDRYILSNEKLIIVGHGLKDIGNKESFIFVLEKTNCQDIYNLLSDNFENRWKKANFFQ